MFVAKYFILLKNYKYLKKSFNNRHGRPKTRRVGHAVLSIFKLGSAFLKTLTSWVSTARVLVSAVAKNAW